MIYFTVEPNAGPKVAAYMEHVRSRILAAIRGGMREAMTDLAQWIVANKLSGNPIGRQAAANKFTKPGDLAASILKGVRVGGNEEVIYGTLSGRPKGMPNLGYWQEFGTKHKTFSIPPRPFLNPSLHEREAQIVATIRARLREADLS